MKSYKHSKEIFDYKQNDLFQPGRDIKLNACVGKNGGPYNYKDYSKGYFEAGRRIVNDLDGNYRYIDILVYPIVFLNRHAIELGLKHLAQYLPLLFGEEQQLKQTHKLMDNWILVKKYIIRLPEGGDDPEPISIVDGFLGDFVQLDPKGQTFRFPEDTMGELHLQNISIINIRVFAEAMKKVYEAFDFWFTAVDYFNEKIFNDGMLTNDETM